MYSPYIRDIENANYQSELAAFEKLINNWSSDFKADRRNIINALTVVFGNEVQRGWINQCAEDVLRNEGSQTNARMEKFLSLLGPTCPLGKMLLDCKQESWPLKINLLPTHYQSQLAQFRKQQQTRRRMNIANNENNQIPISPLTQQYAKRMSSAERFIEQDHCNTNILECFMVTTLVSLRRWSTIQLYFLDDFFYSLSHNPLLVLIRRYLDFFAFNNKYQKDFEKYCFLISQYFVKDISKGIGSLNTLMLAPVATPLNPYLLQSREIFKPNQKYQHYLHIVYLLIYYYRGRLDHKDMEAYFTILVTPEKSLFIQQGLISQIMRVWLYYLRPFDRIECQLVATLNAKNENAYKVKRIPNKWYIDENEEVLVNNKPVAESHIFQQIIKILSAASRAKCFTWRQFNQLDAMMKYFKVEEDYKDFNKAIDNQKDAHDLLKDIQDWVQEWRTKPDRRLSGRQQTQIVEEMQEMLGQIWRGIRAIYKLDRFVDQPRSESKRFSGRMEYPLIRRDEVRSSPWLAPIARYEFPPAFYLWMAVAKMIDILLIRGLRSFPRTNLRWMTSYSSTLMLLIFVIFVFFFKK